MLLRKNNRSYLTYRYKNKFPKVVLEDTSQAKSTTIESLIVKQKEQTAHRLTKRLIRSKQPSY